MVIDTATNACTKWINLGGEDYPVGIAVHPAGTRIYVTTAKSKSVVIIDMATNTVVGSLFSWSAPMAIAVHPAGTRVYVADQSSNTVSVIDTATNSVVSTIPVGWLPSGIAINPSGNCAVSLSTDLKLHFPIINYNTGALYLKADASCQQAQDGSIVCKVTGYSEENPVNYPNCEYPTLSTNFKGHVQIAFYNNVSYWADCESIPSTDGFIWIKLTGYGQN